ncbi:sulfotransferase family protein [Nonomuraea sp. WAC 01424]|uniref:sulfotransferase family protein n=1 Tax=Nonomuraea sp. WAC 01424 TaxID=2203200 RepID=UPI00163CF97F|nr:sulfotransferase family protein [Nonomuraea sp. WAC 01424]
MKVIGAGVGRTGTLSLKAALERLGLGPCFHGRHVLDHPDRLGLWRAAAARRVVPGPGVFTAFHRQMIWDGFFTGRFADREHAMTVYREHNDAVRREVPADRLLVVEPGASWEPLCAFLDVPAPDEPYPHLNDPERFWARVEARMAESQLLDPDGVAVDDPLPAAEPHGEPGHPGQRADVEVVHEEQAQAAQPRE